MIECRVCLRMFAVLNATHLKQHQLTTQEYRTRFPGAMFRSAEITERQTQTMRAKFKDAGFKRRAVEAMQRKKPSRQRKRTLALAMKRRWKDSEFRAKMSAAASTRMRERWAMSEAFRARMSSVNSARWKNDAFRSKMIKGFRTRRASPKFNAALAVAVKAAWPEARKQAQAKKLATARHRFAEKQKLAAREFTSRRWLDPKFQQRMQPSVAKWTTEERIVCDWLRRLNAYQVHDATSPSFLPHRWLPTRAAGFAANGDFVDYTRKLVVHVDGEHWHNNPKEYPENIERDRRLDDWCAHNGWKFLRLSDIEIRAKGSTGFQKLQEFVCSQ